MWNFHTSNYSPNECLLISCTKVELMIHNQFYVRCNFFFTWNDEVS